MRQRDSLMNTNHMLIDKTVNQSDNSITSRKANTRPRLKDANGKNPTQNYPNLLHLSPYCSPLPPNPSLPLPLPLPLIPLRHDAYLGALQLPGDIGHHVDGIGAAHADAQAAQTSSVGRVRVGADHQKAGERVVLQNNLPGRRCGSVCVCVCVGG